MRDTRDQLIQLNKTQRHYHQLIDHKRESLDKYDAEYRQAYESLNNAQLQVNDAEMLFKNAKANSDGFNDITATAMQNSINELLITLVF